jgi:hypothetical protein
MKTPLQKLMQWFNERPQYDKTSEGYEIMQKAQELLSEEKENICNAYNEGLEGQYIGSEKYYNQTFGCE